MKAAEKSLVFFKIFDLAFFAPGLVLVATGAWLLDRDFDSLKEVTLASPMGILLVLAGIGAIYSVGLVVFSLTWQAFRRISRKRPQEIKVLGRKGWPPFPLLFDAEVRDEMILYFWYLRATCLGLACAFLLSAVAIFVFRNDSVLAVRFALCEVVAAVPLTIQGLGYGRAVDRSLRGKALLVADEVKEAES